MIGGETKLEQLVRPVPRNGDRKISSFAEHQRLGRDDPQLGEIDHRFARHVAIGGDAVHVEERVDVAEGAHRPIQRMVLDPAGDEGQGVPVSRATNDQIGPS